METRCRRALYHHGRDAAPESLVPRRLRCPDTTSLTKTSIAGRRSSAEPPPSELLEPEHGDLPRVPPARGPDSARISAWPADLVSASLLFYSRMLPVTGRRKITPTSRLAVPTGRDGVNGHRLSVRDAARPGGAQPSGRGPGCGVRKLFLAHGVR